MLLTVAAGGLVAAQAPANNVISNSVGNFGAALISFLVGTLLILVLTFTVAGGFQGEEGAQSPAWYYWILGGVGGAAIVVVTLITVRELGAGGATAAVIAGQLALSVLLDRAGVRLGHELLHRLLAIGGGVADVIGLRARDPREALAQLQDDRRCTGLRARGSARRTD